MGGAKVYSIRMSGGNPRTVIRASALRTAAWKVAAQEKGISLQEWLSQLADAAAGYDKAMDVRNTGGRPKGIPQVAYPSKVEEVAPGPPSQPEPPPVPYQKQEKCAYCKKQARAGGAWDARECSCG